MPTDPLQEYIQKAAESLKTSEEIQYIIWGLDAAHRELKQLQTRIQLLENHQSHHADH